jgi:hypothetical protein
MNRYQLTVRGETVHLTFKRINDSRRLTPGLRKNPNLFGVRAAMLCSMELPCALSPEWWRTSEHNPAGGPHWVQGVAYCSRKDRWSSLQGRHRALADALDYYGHSEELNAEIKAAFTEEERKRMPKPKGPERTPRTAKPKPRRPGQRQLLARAVALLEQIAQRPAFVVSDTIYDDAKMLVEQTAQRLGAGGTHPQYLPQYLKPGSGESLIGAAEKVRPADSTANPTPSPYEHETTGGDA